MSASTGGASVGCLSFIPRRAKYNFLDAHVFAAADFNAYLMTCGGLPRLRELREQAFLLTPRGPGPG